MANLVRIGVRLANKSLFAKTEVTSVRFISGKLLRGQDDRPPKPAPWNYKEKSYTILNYWTDRTTSRLDENSKIVVVEGPVAAGKSKFAKELAEELDMLYMPEANLDMVYINDYGYDLRQLDEQLPESCRSFDVKDFLRTPKHRNTATFQLMQYNTKYSQYIDALAHVLSTGQGVVLDRCCYSDFVFVEAMFSQGYLSKAAYKGYYEVRQNTINELLRPHLLIYLDVPVNKVQENIKKRALPFEKNTQVLTPQYLSVMEKNYKQKYLKELSKHAELLIYDWSEGGEVEIVVEDIERIDFDNYDIHDPKCKDWRRHTEEDWGALRNKYADHKNDLMNYFNVPLHHVPEMVIDAEDAKVYHDIMNNAPGEVYQRGFNTDMGDTGVLFKISLPHRDTLPLRERNLAK
ncbi:NADH dehydrogenase [ubiquinone] 1 alpha subcomplex subunit 10, mitochondrial [Tribolium castaneum]|uniref:NADH dehydrogenase [ubiquinone] 1 alpha subcomplex subunit 10, mitochondrial n=1 Tax=Tribolium castaneum TaxID=7070 RepID=D1ZZE8_TRICA|nr:PREDICTED: NADH dehydrogenase [ubiquinone] 1 alpha subcomplex subunit 10, mitochondrial [Tribolium castaneum]EFA02878.1 NADH dehydrogenase (ubiquinone) 1 alpha subcomplex, 10 [Tribolium castaneum]|eukprot:XP_971851.1 PREDICTED: NADH dehydrogenase [ubiquinone] 1 alpha subcomplex subunit 10, mitochondrial [Tribolium castaneum]